MLKKYDLFEALTLSIAGSMDLLELVSFSIPLALLSLRCNEMQVHCFSRDQRAKCHKAL